jgi:hypothetical protein
MTHSYRKNPPLFLKLHRRNYPSTYSIVPVRDCVSYRTLCRALAIRHNTSFFYDRPNLVDEATGIALSTNYYFKLYMNGNGRNKGRGMWLLIPFLFSSEHAFAPIKTMLGHYEQSSPALKMRVPPISHSHYSTTSRKKRGKSTKVSRIAGIIDVSLRLLTFSSFSSIICGATDSSASTTTVLAATSVSILLTPAD